ncbi:MAG: Holliday junction resolvase RuvX [Rickettsiales bacterium]|nr:Holliday junction resolvase RuvX [Rickettsiales bacterium]
MIFDTLSDFYNHLKTGDRIIGLDIGSKKIGIAISDTTQMIASPHDILTRENFNKDTGRIRTLCKEFNACAMVIGYPKQLNNDEGALCEKLRQFAVKFDKKHQLPIFLQDERFSTSESVKLMQSFDFTRKRQHETDDKIAATLILQTALDSLAHISPKSE